ncbi:MAG: APC family permease [Actinomycetes bacterium]
MSGKNLVKNLNVWEAIGISVALMAPSMAANINPQGTAGVVGRAVPVAFALATIGVLLVAYGFVRLTQNFNHAGSVYGFVGATMGPRSGVVAGWGLLGTYIFYGCVTSMAAGIFGSTFLDELGVWHHQPAWSGFLIGAIALVLAYVLAIAPARNGTRVLLSVEGVTVLLILITTVIIFAKLAGGHAPDNHHVDWSVFSIPKGVGTSGVFLGVVFGFLSFAGFEAAATLGEETKNPRKDIPRAMLGTAIFGGVYFVIVTAVEVMGFGTDAAGVKAYVSSGSLLGDLGTKYVGSWIGTVITLGAAISAFGCCLACVVGGARLSFSLARDGGNASLSQLSEKNGVPVNATRVVVGAAAIIMIVWKLIWHVKPFDIFLGSGVIGTLIILVAYLLATVGAIKFLFFSGKKRTKQWEIIIPIAGIALLLYTLYKNVIPFPTSGPGRAYPIVGAIWLLIGIVAIVSRPALAAKIGAKLTADEKLSEARS